MTTGQSSVGASPVMQSPPCRMDKRKRRKMKRACCCITFLLLINAFLLMHTAHSIGAIMWFMMNGSYTYDDTTYIFVPGGAKTLCNDLCVDMCIYNQVNCELNSCLNTCNQKLIDDGNEDDFQQIQDQPVINGIEQDAPMLDQQMGVDYIDEETDDDDGDDDDVDEPLVLVDTPPINEDPQTKLDEMQALIEKAAENIREMKESYAADCGSNPETVDCKSSKVTIEVGITALKASINEYDTYAVSVSIDIQVSTWMLDVDDVTASP